MNHPKKHIRTTEKVDLTDNTEWEPCPPMMETIYFLSFTPVPAAQVESLREKKMLSQCSALYWGCSPVATENHEEIPEFYRIPTGFCCSLMLASQNFGTLIFHKSHWEYLGIPLHSRVFGVAIPPDSSRYFPSPSSGRHGRHVPPRKDLARRVEMEQVSSTQEVREQINAEIRRLQEKAEDVEGD